VSDKASAKPARRTQAERRDETERRLLESAARLIAERGIVRTSLADVGQAAGYSRGIVNSHFGSKAALVERISGHVAQLLAERGLVAASRRKGLPALRAIVRAYLEQLSPDDPFARANLILWTEAIAAEPTLRASKSAADTYFRAEVARIVRMGVADGTIRPDVDATSFAVAFVGLLRGVALELLLDPDQLDGRQATRAVLAVVDANLAPRR
jgi:AcrR family transcriptional regulator